MPKKKLTKAQVKRKLKTMMNALYDFNLDKFGHGPGSFVPLSVNKIITLHKEVSSALRRIK